MPPQKALLWQYFDCKSNRNNTGKVAICKSCRKELQGHLDRMAKHLAKCQDSQAPQIGISEDVFDSYLQNQSSSSTHYSTSTLVPPKKPKLLTWPSVSGLNEDFIPTPFLMTKEPIDEITRQLARSYFATNTPFHHIEHKEVRKLFHLLRPEYEPPSAEQLESELLNEIHKEIFDECKITFEDQTVSMSLNGWESIGNSDPIVSLFITNQNGESAFVESIDTSGHSRTTEYLEQIAQTAIAKFEKEFEVSIRSFVTDSTQNVSKLRRLLDNNETIDILQYNCSAHILNLLANDVGRMVPISESLDRMLSGQTTIAVAVEIWHQLGLDLRNEEPLVQEQFRRRKDMALNATHFLANMLDHRFRGCHMSDTEKGRAYEHIAEIHKDFVPLLMAYCAGDKPFPKFLFDKNFRSVNPITWWKSVSTESTELDWVKLQPLWLQMCFKYLTATASTAEADLQWCTRTFSDGLVQPKLINNIESEKAGKLTFVFKNLNQNVAEPRKNNLKWIWPEDEKPEKPMHDPDFPDSYNQNEELDVKCELTHLSDN